MHEEVIPILRVRKAADAVPWYARMGFHQEWEHRFEPGFPAFVSIARRNIRLFLSEHEGDARPDTLVYMRVPLPEVRSIAKEFSIEVQEPPWGTYELRDPDGNRLRIGTPKILAIEIAGRG